MFFARSANWIVRCGGQLDRSGEVELINQDRQCGELCIELSSRSPELLAERELMRRLCFEDHLDERPAVPGSPLVRPFQRGFEIVEVGQWSGLGLFHSTEHCRPVVAASIRRAADSGVGRGRCPPWRSRRPTRASLDGGGVDSVGEHGADPEPAQVVRSLSAVHNVRPVDVRHVRRVPDCPLSRREHDAVVQVNRRVGVWMLGTFGVEA